MSINILISDEFKFGQTNNRKFIDLPFLNQSQLGLVIRFLQEVSNDKALLGKNKPSWLNDQLDDILSSENYKANNFWHYHCGEFDPHAKVRRLTYHLQLNLEGLTSAAIIHYQKITDDEIILVGFSPIHIPFPLENDPDNPLFG